MTTTRSTDRDLRQDVAEVLVRYATGVDRRDWELFRSCFTDDCEADYGDIGHWHDDGATARCYLDAVVMTADDRSAVRTVGYCDDEQVHTDTGWRIARRRCTMVFCRTETDLGGPGR